MRRFGTRGRGRRSSGVRRQTDWICDAIQPTFVDLTNTVQNGIGFAAVTDDPGTTFFRTLIAKPQLEEKDDKCTVVRIVGDIIISDPRLNTAGSRHAYAASCIYAAESEPNTQAAPFVNPFDSFQSTNQTEASDRETEQLDYSLLWFATMLIAPGTEGIFHKLMHVDIRVSRKLLNTKMLLVSHMLKAVPGGTVGLVADVTQFLRVLVKLT